MAFVFKIKYEESLRRFTVPKTSTGAPDLTFAQLEAKIREYFQIRSNSKLVITYMDKDDDVITISEDQELHDACVLQAINPLRLDVMVEGQCRRKFEVREMGEVMPAVEAALKAFHPLAADSVKEMLEPLMKDGLKDGLSQRVSDVMQAVMNSCSQQPAEAAGPGKKTEGESSHQTQGPAVNRNEGLRTGLDGVFHYNVQCDACGLSPIVGPRFKSISKDDYDLCLSCFNNLPRGQEVDYTRYDRPLQRGHGHHHPSFGGRMGRCPALSHRAYGPRGPHGFRCDSRGHDNRYDSHGLGNPNMAAPGFLGSWANFKPDGRFVCDVTIPDGTEVAPCTPFVKIWRLRNSGKVTWGHNTQLVRVGGDELGLVSAVTLQLPEGGVAPEAEIEVAVDLLAPERPGRYVSYWRLMTPYGQKFGHRVWALIQVTPKGSNSGGDTEPIVTDKESEAVGADSIPVTMLNGAMRNGSEEVTIDDDTSVDSVQPDPLHVEDHPMKTVSVPVHGVPAEFLPAETEAVNAPSVEDPVEAGVDLLPVEKTRVGGFSLVEMPAKDGLKEDSVPAGVKQEDAKEEASVQEALLEELQSMGFGQRDLNIELLQKNENDIQRTLEDLFAAAEWDPILEELEEMGFYDAEMNRRLMFKNNGSVKRVVKELVQMYKEPAAKQA